MVHIYLTDYESTNLQKLSDALNDPKMHFAVLELLLLEEGPISSALALALEELLLSTKHQRRWRIRVYKCYLKDEEASAALAQAFYKAFSQGRIEVLYMHCLDSTNERGRDMLLAVFGMANADDDNQHSQSNTLDLCLNNCILDHTMIPYLQSWARDAATVSELVIDGDCFRWPDTPTTTECIAKMFERARKTPIDLDFWNMSLIGDMGCLQDWNLRSISISGMCNFSSMTGLSMMLPSLKKLTMRASIFSSTDLGIIALLEDPNNRIESLILQSGRVENEFTLALVQALSNKNSLICLDIGVIRIDDPSTGHALVNYLRSNPPSLKDLSVPESMFSKASVAVDDICHVLRSENCTLERMRIYGFTTSLLSALILPYLVRNRAGRRILLCEQVLPSLMGEVLGRVQWMEIDRFYCVELDESNVLRADATYHLVREGLAGLLSSRKRQRANSLDAEQLSPVNTI